MFNNTMASFGYNRSDLAKISQYMFDLKEHNGVYLDIGCGAEMNMSRKMITTSDLTVLMEPDQHKASIIEPVFATRKNVTLLNQVATPQNIEGTIKEHIGSKDITFLDLDIDSYDFDLLQAILQVKKPYLIMAEINEKIPYPIEFHVCYDYSYDGSHCYGMSFASFCNLVHEDYDVMTLNKNNAFAIRKDMNASSETRCPYGDLYESGYRKPRLGSQLPEYDHNSNVDHWLTLEPEKAIKQINKFFKDYKDKYTLLPFAFQNFTPEEREEFRAWTDQC